MFYNGFLKFITITAFLYAAHAANANNLAENGGFESWHGNQPQGWQCDSQNTSKDSDIKKNGKYSIKLTINKRKKVLVVDKKIKFIPDKKYKLSFWVKSINGGERIMVIAGGNLLDNNGFVGTKWMKKEYTFVAKGQNSKSELLRLAYSTYPPKSLGTIYFDDVSLSQEKDTEDLITSGDPVRKDTGSAVKSGVSGRVFAGYSPQMLYAAGNGNLLSNPGFEAFSPEENIWGWLNPAKYNGRYGTVKLEQEQPLFGKCSLMVQRFKDISKQDPKGSGRVGLRQDFYYLKNGEKYVLSGYVKSPDNLTAKLALQLWFAETPNGIIKTEKSVSLQGPSDWKKLTISITAPENTDAWLCVSAACEIEKGIGKAYFDGLSLMPIKEKTNEKYEEPSYAIASGLAEDMNIFYPEETKTLKINLRKLSGKDKAVPFSIKIYDYKKQLVKSISQELELSTAKDSCFSLNITKPESRGEYTVVTQLGKGEQSVRSAFRYYIISKPTPAKDIENEIFGMHRAISEKTWDKLTLNWEALGINLKYSKKLKSSPLKIPKLSTERKYFFLVTHPPVWTYCRNQETAVISPLANEVEALFEEIFKKMPAEQCRSLAVLGEVNDGIWSTEEYCKFLKAAYKGARRSQSDIKVSTCVPARIPGGISYLKKIIRLGAMKHCDILSCDPYTSPNSPEAAMWENTFRGLIDCANRHEGKKQDIWLYEIGWPAGGNSQLDVSVADQANFLVRMYLLTYPVNRIKKIFWYKGKGGAVGGAKWGISYYAENSRNKYFVLRPAFIAFANLITELRDSLYSSRDFLGPSKTNRVYYFQNDKAIKAVVWKAEGKSNLHMSSNVDYTVVDIFGNDIKNKKHIYNIDGAPKYFCFKTKDGLKNIEKIFKQARIEEKAGNLPPVNIELYIDNPSKAPPLHVKLENPSGQMRKGKITFPSYSGIRFSPARIDFKLAPRAQGIYRVGLPGFKHTEKNIFLTDLEVNESDSNEYSLKKYINFHLCKFAGSKLKIDGDLSDWLGAYPIIVNSKSQLRFYKHWSGSTDISGMVYTMWDNKYFYIAAKIFDDEFNIATDKLWKGDAIQFSLCDLNSKNSYGTNDCEFVMAKSNSGNKIRASWLGKKAKKEIEGKLAVKITKNSAPLPHYICYEAAIPISQLHALKPVGGHKFRLNFVICDNDGGVLEGGIGLMPGIFGKKTPETGVTMQLVK